EPTGPGSETVVVSKIDTYGAVLRWTIGVNLGSFCRFNSVATPRPGRCGFLTASSISKNYAKPRLPALGTMAGFKMFLKLSMFPRRTRFGWGI
ncbi:MAG: hypothetical protein OXI63_20070, partial [Candidatus Poribacteria bacterium]|nr:hypothetical protein [Candidatus Poribacteria bacterium]